MWLLAPTCLFLASKVEEFGVISNTKFVQTCQQVVKLRFGDIWPQISDYPYKIAHILECEFFLLEMLVSILLIPLRSPLSDGVQFFNCSHFILLET